MSIQTSVNKIVSNVGQYGQKISNSITQKTAEMTSKGVEPSAVWKYLDAKASQATYFPRLREIEKVMSEFKQVIGMENKAKIHNYYGLQTDTVKVRGFVQNANDFLKKLEELKSSGKTDLIDVLKKADNLGIVQFNKFEPFDNDNIISGRYTRDLDLLARFRKILYE